MAQCYFTPTNVSQSLPDLSKASTNLSNASTSKVAMSNDVQAAYVQQKEQYVPTLMSIVQ